MGCGVGSWGVLRRPGEAHAVIVTVSVGQHVAHCSPCDYASVTELSDVAVRSVVSLSIVSRYPVGRILALSRRHPMQ